jgi:hypothetical protein
MLRPKEGSIGMTTGTNSGSTSVPDGVYEVAFDGHRITTRFGRGSLELWFRVVEFGPWFETRLCRYYKVHRSGKRSFRAGPHSVFTREFAAVFGKRPPAGIQAVRWYGNDMMVKARVETVLTGHDQKKIPEPARYSVIRELLERSRS